MKKPHLSIIIPVLNLWRLTRNCLESLRHHTSGSFFEVIVIDNGSGDETPAECPAFGHKLFGDMFRYVRQEENINFGPACNLGASLAHGELLFFLNNDTLLTDGWYVPLLSVFKSNRRVMAVSPLCLFPESERVQHLGICFDGGLAVRHPYFLFPSSHRVVSQPRRLQALSAAAMMISADVFKRFNGFFPGYANGFEDIDLCCRMRKAGGELVQENSSVIYHLASQTPGRNSFDADNIKLVNERCAGCFRPDLHTLAGQDGFTCELTSWLEMILRDPEVDCVHGLESLSGETELIAALEQYPLWEHGYDKISALFEKIGRFDLATDYLLYGSTFFPSINRLARLEVIAGKAGRVDMRDHARSKASNIRGLMASRKMLVRRAENIISWAELNNDLDLARIYKDWIQD